MVCLSRAAPVGNFSFNLNWDFLVGLNLDNFGYFLTFFYLLLFTFFFIPEVKNSYMSNKTIKIIL